LKIIYVLADTIDSRKFIEKVIASDEVVELNKSLGDDDCMEVSIEHQENISK